MAGEHASVQNRSGELFGWHVDDVVQARVRSQVGRRSRVRRGWGRRNKAAEAEE
jgi:hypothetical protein